MEWTHWRYPMKSRGVTYNFSKVWVSRPTISLSVLIVHASSTYWCHNLHMVNSILGDKCTLRGAIGFHYKWMTINYKCYSVWKLKNDLLYRYIFRVWLKSPPTSPTPPTPPTVISSPYQRNQPNKQAEQAGECISIKWKFTHFWTIPQGLNANLRGQDSK